MNIELLTKCGVSSSILEIIQHWIYRVCLCCERIHGRGKLTILFCSNFEIEIEFEIPTMVRNVSFPEKGNVLNYEGDKNKITLLSYNITTILGTHFLAILGCD